MRSKYLRAVTALLMMISVLAAAGAGAPAERPGVSDEHKRIVEFWTNERVAQAIPRDFVLTNNGTFRPEKKPDKPGKPGGGGGDSTAITGASWAGSEVVADTTGKVLFALGTSYYVCSASVVTDMALDRSIVLTAAHCAYDLDTDVFATNWMFIPNYDEDPVRLDAAGNFCSKTLHGCWTAESLVVHSGYTSAGGFNEDAVVFDFAFAVMRSGGHGEVLVETLGSQAIDFTPDDGVGTGTVVDAFGYPAARPYRGKDLVYCEGEPGFDPNVSNDGTYKLACDMTGGSSGGPWLMDLGENGQGTLVSLNSYGYSGDKSMHGPKFNDSTAAVFARALTVPFFTDAIVGSG